MNIKKHIPNFLTCCNLLCGCIGLIIALLSWSINDLSIASYLIFIACIFDFFDGFVARLLKVSSPIGKELDSFADMVTFGVLPSAIMFRLIAEMRSGIIIPKFSSYPEWLEEYVIYVSFIAFAISIFSALRLAKFNIDTRQSDSFIGVPTPANAILIASFPLIIDQNKFPFIIAILTNAYCLLSIALIMSYLLIAELPLFALKFKSFKWAENQVRYSFLISSLLLFIFLIWTAIPLIIFLYVILSLIENKTLKAKAQ